MYGSGVYAVACLSCNMCLFTASSIIATRGADQVMLQLGCDEKNSALLTLSQSYTISGTIEFVAAGSAGAHIEGYGYAPPVPPAASAATVIVGTVAWTPLTITPAKAGGK